MSGPPTIEEQISPFHLDTSPGRTIQGMPAARFPEPKITTASQVLTPPSVIRVPSAIPSSLDAVPPDGPTVPDGVPALLAPAPQSDELPLDEMATDPYAGQRVRGVVPHPDSPKIQISKSMEYDVAALGPLHDEEKTAAVRPPRYVAPPTEVVLPALSRAKKKPKERSDAWLVVGLLFLMFVILALIVAVVVGVVHRMA